MASDLISREALIKELEDWYDRVGDDSLQDRLVQNIISFAIDDVNDAPTIDAIPIDTVAEMLAGMYGDCCPCNYLDIDEGISVDCKRKNCPGFFETDYSCWKKYIKHWLKRKMDGGKE